jgi:hypothetical protein
MQTSKNNTFTYAMSNGHSIVIQSMTTNDGTQCQMTMNDSRRPNYARSAK